jgi:uncharacterized membrane protein YeaQ/YmgE (transglycosylase-associated protein family)
VEPVPASFQLPINMTAFLPNAFSPRQKGASVPQASVLACILVGILLGWFSTGITKGRGVGLFVNVVVGITSAIFGAWFLPDIGRTVGFGALARAYPTVAATLDGAITAAIALWALRFVKKA